MRARLVSLAVATPLALATSLALAALLALAATTPALADPAPGDDSGPSHHGSNGPGSGHGGDGSDDGGSGHGGDGPEDGHADGDDDAERRAPSAQGSAGAAEAAPKLANPGRHATVPGAGPASTAARGASQAASTRLSAPEPAPPVGSVAERRPGVAARSTPPDLVGVAGVAGAVLLLAAMVAAGFRARARLGRLG